MQLSKHFSRAELACKHCGRIGPYAQRLKKLLVLLEKIRGGVGKAVRVTSGYRCPAHNREVGGVSNSYHMLDMAADIYVPGMKLQDLARIAEKAGAGGIGVYPYSGFVHVDVGPWSRWTQAEGARR